jgi:hypothetical protein
VIPNRGTNDSLLKKYLYKTFKGSTDIQSFMPYEEIVGGSKNLNIFEI